MWTKEEMADHLKLNLGDESYSAAVVVAALYKKIYGEFPKIGMSGFQAEAAAVVIDNMPDVGIKGAIDVLRNELLTDEGYRIGWVANIAMAYVDTAHKYNGSETTHHVANEAAESFLKNLCS